jgi:hypothetical protein
MMTTRGNQPDRSYLGEHNMNKLLLAATAALLMATGAAIAQTTTTTESTTTVTPSPPAPLLVAPPPGTLAVTSTQRTIAPDGSQTEKTETTYRNPAGVADESVTRTTTTPIPVIASTTTWSSSSTTVTGPAPVVQPCPPRTRYDVILNECVN